MTHAGSLWRLAMIATICGACSGQGQAPDAGAAIDLTRPDLGPCGPGLYPCGPYGSAVGQVAANLSFSALADPDHLCKDTVAMKQDLGPPRAIALADWHRGGAACSTKTWRLLWVMVSAGWCASCKTEVAGVQASIDAAGLDPRVAVLNVVYETTVVKQPVGEDFLRTWAQAYGLTFPVAMDPAFTMGAYFSRGEAPFNLLLELKTMTILYRRTGSDLPGIEGAIKTALGS